MQLQPQGGMDADDLRDIDWRIIEILEEGRNNAPNIANQVDMSRQYITERLTHLKTGDIVTNIGSGIYELNPEEVPERDG
jgi:DNA-binding Lrp family transcriptional regulator